MAHRRFLFLTLIFASTSILAAPPAPIKKSSWSPFMLSAYPDRFMLPRVRSVYGLELSLGKSGASKFVGFQIAAVQADAHDANGFQIGTLWAESDYADGFQIALLPLTRNRLRGLQIGLANNLRLEGKDRFAVSGIQLGAMNSAERLKGVQIGVLNNATRMRGLQFGILNYSINERGLLVGAANVVGADDDTGRVAKGFHLGLLNIATQEFQGLQIGLINSVDRLKGVQVGVVNYVRHPQRRALLLVPLINIGW